MPSEHTSLTFVLKIIQAKCREVWQSAAWHQHINSTMTTDIFPAIPTFLFSWIIVAELEETAQHIALFPLDI